MKSPKETPRPPGKRSWLQTALKVCYWVFGVLVVLFIGVWIGILCYFTPGRITKIVNEEASKYLKAEVKIENLNYKFFSTYPRLCLTYDSLTVISHSLEQMPAAARDTLPEGYDILLTTGPVAIEMNFPGLLDGKINIRSAELAHPYVNLLQVSDSLNNFNILPDESIKMKKPPKVKVGKVTITEPVEIRYSQLQKSINVIADLDQFELSRIDKRNYAMNFGVDAQITTPMFSMDKPVRLDVDGRVNFDLSPLKLSLRDLALKTEPLTLKCNLDIEKKGEDFIADLLNITVETADIFKCLEYLPTGLLELPQEFEKVDGVLPMKVNVALAEPYTLPTKFTEPFELSMLPGLNLTADVNDAWLSYALSKNDILRIDALSFTAEAGFDPKSPDNTYFRLPEFWMVSEGLEIGSKIDVGEIMSDHPVVSGNLALATSHPEEAVKMAALSGLRIDGKLEGNIDFSCIIDNPAQMSLRDLSVEGEISAPILKIEYAGAKMKADLKNTKAGFNLSLPSLSKGSSPKGKVQFSLTNGTGRITTPDMSMSSGGLTLDADADNLTPKSGTSLDADLKLGLASFNLSTGGNALDMAGLNLALNGGLLNSPKNYTANYTAPAMSEDEKILMERVKSTPMYLVPNAPGVLAALMTMADAQLDLSIDAGKFDTPYYAAVNLFSEINLTTDFDNIRIKSLNATIDDSKMNLYGDIEGLGGFLTSGSPSILKADLNVDFTNVDIDRLSGAYYAAIEKQTGKPYDFTMPPQGPYTAADSICVLIPRNLEAIVRLKSKSAEYMGYRFSPLSTDIILNGGNATLSRLSIGAPYCSAVVDWTYSTASLADIYMSLEGDVNDFDFTRFFKVFPKLTAGAPELSNLTGSISAGFNGRFSMFPSMFLDAPSMQAKFNLRGDNIRFARTGKIERITHLMRIKGDEPLQMKDLLITGSFHDCLLMVDPFHIVLDNYQIGVAGVNNLQGGMYYHLALEKSPFHLPFAVNLVGRYPHPEVRFGGTEVKDEREREISADLRQDVNINIMTWLHRGWIMFVEEAAKYDLKRTGE